MKYINEANFRYLCDGLTLEMKDLEVIEAVLVGLNSKDGLIDRLIDHNRKYGPESTFETKGAQIIVECDKYLASGRKLSTATVSLEKKSHGLPPVLFINLHSPTLDIPQRVEIPLRYVLDGMISLKGTFMVYLHALEINNQETFVYYGITKRGWMKRFKEHMRLAMKGSSHRMFPKLLGDSIISKIRKVFNQPGLESNNFLTASYHVVCAAGRTRQNASAIEKYLIKKRSLSQKEGLNMV